MQFRFLLLVCVCTYLAPLHAADIYRWVDDRGQTQMSDKVPEEYRDKAEKINSQRFELTPEQKAEAQARAARERQSAEIAARSEKIKQRLSARNAPGVNQSQDDHKKNAAPAAVPSGVQSCEDQWNSYNAIASCFKHIGTSNGAKLVDTGNCPGADTPAPDCPMPSSP